MDPTHSLFRLLLTLFSRVAQAKTGTGKTIAFLLPLLQRMINDDATLATKRATRTARSDDIRGIVLSPTRELAEQIAAEARCLTRHTGLVVQSAVGGTRKGAMLQQTQRQGCHLLVATPGRLNDLLQDPSSGIDAPNLAALVLDEADRMLDVGFEQELNDILRCLPDRNDKVRQTILVSATIPDDVIRLARSMVRPHEFEFVQTISENESLTHDKIPQHMVPVASWANMFPTLWELIDRELAKTRDNPGLPPFKAIVYFNTTALVELAAEMGFHRRRSHGMRLPVFSIQSKLSQMQRTRAAELFRNSRSAVLFSSDVTARGMDFPNVTHVIQVDTPRDRESYIHRLGRTGRQNKDGEGWILLPPTSMSPARRLLDGLPIQPNKTLEAAAVASDAEEPAGHHKETLELAEAIPKSAFAAAYVSVFGSHLARKSDLVPDLNHWAVHGWGLPEPPQVSQMWASKQGMLNAGLNIRQEEGRERSRFSNDRDQTRRFGSRFSGRGRSSDPFEDMGRQVRRDGSSFNGRHGPTSSEW